MALGKPARAGLAVGLLLLSNCFMTAAWYTHLKFKGWHTAQAIFVSWAIALPEYALQVPANRIGHAGAGGPFSAAQLKVIAEFFSLVTFAAFSSAVLKEPLRWVDLGAFALICGGVVLSLLTKPAAVKQAEAELAAPPAAVGGGRLSDATVTLTDAAGGKAPAEAALGAATPAVVAMESAAEGEGAGGGAARRRSSSHQGAGGDRE
jgi:uncharacterized protein (DUF486 family)